jgi:phosphoglycolate phosphatase-like HAD superfamily hydrolase
VEEARSSRCCDALPVRYSDDQFSPLFEDKLAPVPFLIRRSLTTRGVVNVLDFRQPVCCWCLNIHKEKPCNQELFVLRLVVAAPQDFLMNNSARHFTKMSSVYSQSTTSRFRRPTRRFAPLNPEKPNSYSARQLKGIVFDVDGTLCLPQNYMFSEMRKALGITKPTDILEHIRSLSHDPEAQRKAIKAIKDIEIRTMAVQEPQPGLRELMAYLQSRKVRKALCTRNFQKPVDHLLSKFLSDKGDGQDRVGRFHPIITRETPNVTAKPSPEGLWRIALVWDPAAAKNTSHTNGDVKPNDPLEKAKRYLGSSMIMVGDSIDDITCGRRAGAATVLLVNEDNEHLIDDEYTDLAIRRLDELIPVLENGFVGRGGFPAKVSPNHIEDDDI